MEAIFNTKLRCPANNQEYDSQYTGGGSGSSVNIPATATNYSSYSAMLMFHHSRKTVASSGSLNHVRLPDAVRLGIGPEYPAGYSPRLDALTNPGQRAYVMDGARFVEVSNGSPQASFNPFTKQVEGGNFMAKGPGVSGGGGSPYKFDNHQAGEVSAAGKQYAYRHGEKINAAFFDGHAATMMPRESLDISLYFPSGTRLARGGGEDPNASAGTVVE
jgi:prepilin-type processing-associated H-X9-DG protein